MLVPDVNVFVNAYRPESEHHAEDLAWLERSLQGTEPVGICEQVLASFVRIVTHRRIFDEPTHPREALEFCEVVRSAPSALRLSPGERHWGIFAALCRDVGARGVVVPDAYLAALALEKSATWVTHDRGFARFPGLRWITPTS